MVSLLWDMVLVMMGLSIGWLRTLGELSGVKKGILGCKGVWMLRKDFVA